MKKKKRKIKRKVKKKRSKKSKEKGKKKLKVIPLIFVLVAIAAVTIVAFTFLHFQEIKQKSEYETKIVSFEPYLKKPLGNSTQVTMYLPAVDGKGNGVITTLVVEAIPNGNGRVLVDIDNILFWADTQHSIRIARKVAANISHVNVSNYDIIYSIYANASVIGGESAGAAITIATIAALLNKTLRKDVLITGTINHDGTIGPVKAVLAKAKAAKSVNATLFLVPLLQSYDVVYKTRRHCERFGFTEICTTETIPKKIEVSEEAGIKVIEVSSVEEAMKYFFK